VGGGGVAGGGWERDGVGVGGGGVAGGAWERDGDSLGGERERSTRSKNASASKRRQRSAPHRHSSAT